MKIFVLLPIAGTYSQVQLRMAKGKKQKVPDGMFMAPSGELYKPSDCGVDGNGKFKNLLPINYRCFALEPHQVQVETLLTGWVQTRGKSRFREHKGHENFRDGMVCRRSS